MKKIYKTIFLCLFLKITFFFQDQNQFNNLLKYSIEKQKMGNIVHSKRGRNCTEFNTLSTLNNTIRENDIKYFNKDLSLDIKKLQSLS